jgi:hypothetical protein
MTILNGGSGKRAVTDMTDAEYIGLFVSGITDHEWAYLRHLPPITRVPQLVNVVVHLRQQMASP